MDLTGLHAKLADVITDVRTRLGQVDANAFASALMVAVEEFLATPAPAVSVPVSAGYEAFAAPAAPVDGSTLPPITGTLNLSQGPQVSTPPAG